MAELYYPTRSRDGAAVAGQGKTATANGTEFLGIGVWNMSDGAARWTALAAPVPSHPQIAFTQDGSPLMALTEATHTHGTDHSAFCVWDAASGALLRVFGVDNPVRGFVPDGSRLATGYAIWCPRLQCPGLHCPALPRSARRCT